MKNIQTFDTMEQKTNKQCYIHKDNTDPGPPPNSLQQGFSNFFDSGTPVNNLLILNYTTNRLTSYYATK